MQLKNKLIALVVVIALAIGGAAWWKWHDSSTPAQKRVAIGDGVLASGGDVARLTAEPAPKFAAEKLVATRLTKPYDISVRGGGNLASPVTLWLPTTAKPGDAVMLASKHPGKPWDYFGAKRGDVQVVTIDGQNYLRATVPHLSIDIGFSPVDWVKDQWRATLNKATAGIVVDTSVPDCRDQATAGKLGYGLGVAQKGAITACAGYNSDAAEVIVKNVKHYPLVAHHKGFKRTKNPTSQLSVAALTKYDNADRTTLMPGDTVTLSKKLGYGDHADITTEFNGWTQNMYRVDVSIHAIVQMYEIMRGGKVGYNDIASLVLQSVDCTNAIAKSTVTDLMSSCFPPQLMDKIAKQSNPAVSRLAVLEEFGNGLSTWLVSETSSVLDARGGDRAILRLNRHAPPAPKYELPHSCGKADAYSGTITIVSNSVSCDEAKDVAVAYGRGAAQSRTITSKNCNALAKGRDCHITGSWKCYTVSEGETECTKGSALIHNGTPITVNFIGAWHTHNMTITVTSASKGRIDWGETGEYHATFAYSTLGDAGFAKITSSTLQKLKPNEYYAFKVGAYYNMTLSGGYMLNMANAENPDDSVQACGNGHQTECGM